MSLPAGVAELWNALAPCLDRLDRALTLVFLRQMLDPRLPMIGGHDPRTVLDPAPPWWMIREDEQPARWLDPMTTRINELVSEALLAEGWEALPDRVLPRALEAVTSWAPEAYFCGGDLLGALLESVRGGKPRGAFYTPYNVTYMMASMADAKPGESVIDPACGSGRMLLAALQVCRERHDGVPRLVGIDIDAEAVRVCKLNLLLAGYGIATAGEPDKAAPRS